MNELEKEEYLAYLQSRKSSHKTNWYLECQKQLEPIKKQAVKPKLLLHACCGPCAGWPLEFLHDIFSITILFNNSNIYPEQEYIRRRDELYKLLELQGYHDIEVIVPPYDNQTYTKEVLSNRASDPEGWKRCFQCYAARMEQGLVYAQENGFAYYTTVMTISRQKDSNQLNRIGLSLAEKYPDVTYLVTDFKKKGGQVRRDEIVAQYDLYHQDYCGCIYSYLQRKEPQSS